MKPREHSLVCSFFFKGVLVHIRHATGAVSAPMLASCGVHYCLVRWITFHHGEYLFFPFQVGHSERRKIFSELDGDINHVVERIQESGADLLISQANALIYCFKE